MNIKDKLKHIKMIRTFIKYGFTYNKVENGWYLEWDEFFDQNNLFIVYVPSGSAIYGIHMVTSLFDGVEKKSQNRQRVSYETHTDLENFILRAFDDLSYEYSR